MSSDTPKVINADQVILCKESRLFESQSIILGLRIIFPGDITVDPSNFLNDYLFGGNHDGAAMAGEFRYLPLDKASITDDFFVDTHNLPKETLVEIYQHRVKRIDGNTQVEIMINTQIMESFDEEIAVLNADLADFSLSDYCISWEQIDLT